MAEVSTVVSLSFKEVIDAIEKKAVESFGGKTPGGCHVDVICDGATVLGATVTFKKTFART